MIEDLRRNLQGEEFDYPLLMSYLQKYKNPRNKINRLLQSESIIRIKKGIYVFGPKYRRGPICQELLANWIYGPSYISLHHALSHYGLIPERVATVTSMTSRKDKYFVTPAGNFSYKYIGLKKYAIGIRQVQPSPCHTYLMATPEKALCDLIAHEPRLDTYHEIEPHLIENLRINMDELEKFDLQLIDKIQQSYHNHNLNLLCQFLKDTL